MFGTLNKFLDRTSCCCHCVVTIHRRRLFDPLKGTAARQKSPFTVSSTRAIQKTVLLPPGHKQTVFMSVDDNCITEKCIRGILSTGRPVAFHGEIVGEIRRHCRRLSYHPPEFQYPGHQRIVRLAAFLPLETYTVNR